MTNPSYYEAQVAGRWAWGISQWIGGGWCELVNLESPLEDLNTERRRPDVKSAGVAVISRKRPVRSFTRPDILRAAGRTSRLYASDSFSVAHEARKWCLEHGDTPNLRIALCGYEGEHDEFEEHGWTVVPWKATGGYSRGGQSEINRHLERIWFNPACLHPEPDRQLGLF